MEFQQELNDKIWNIKGDKDLLPEVKDKLFEIANAFIEYLEIPEDSILDMVITGSSASYNYNEFSDLDLHIIVDFDKVHEDCPLVQGYLNALKNTFNKEHDIYIHGVPVELYAEKKDQGTIHNGLYSLNTGWIDFPEKIPPTDNDAAVEAKYQELKDMIDKCEDSENATELLEKIYTMRKAGLAEFGEFCTENLAFKKLRNEGCMDKLRQIKKKDIDKQLTLESYDEEFFVGNDKYIIVPVSYINKDIRILDKKTGEFLKDEKGNNLKFPTEEECSDYIKSISESINETTLSYFDKTAFNRSEFQKLVNEGDYKTLKEIIQKQQKRYDHAFGLEKKSQIHNELDKMADIISSSSERNLDETEFENLMYEIDKVEEYIFSMQNKDYSKEDKSTKAKYLGKGGKKNESYTLYDFDAIVDYIREWRETYFSKVTLDVITDSSTDLDGNALIDITVDVDTLPFTEEQYNQWEDIVNNFYIEKDKYNIYFWCDGSGYHYWTKLQEESNYLMLTLSLKEMELTEQDLNNIELDLSTAMDRYLDKVDEITSINEGFSFNKLTPLPKRAPKFNVGDKVSIKGKNGEIVKIKPMSLSDTSTYQVKLDDGTSVWRYEEEIDTINEDVATLIDKVDTANSDLQTLIIDLKSEISECYSLLEEKTFDTENYKRTRVCEPNTCKKDSFITKEVNDKGDKIILCKDKKTNKLKLQSKLKKKNNEK